jgi:mono/diheme cytochrome c family protein
MSRLFLTPPASQAALVLVLTLLSVAFAAAPPRSRAVTFNKDVAPILFKHCAGCHRPAEIGPFSLLSYKDAAKRANFLKEITADRRMPPWKPVHGYGEFQDERRLSEKEIRVIARWADSGAKEGDPQDLPAAPKFTDGWQLGKPDLILKAARPFTVPAGGRDILRCFVIPTGLKEERTVAAIEFRPSARRVVHHAVFGTDVKGEARKLEKSPGEGYAAPGGGMGVNLSGYLGGWAPGGAVRRLPPRVGRLLLANSDLVIQVHYVPSGKEEQDQPTIGIYFTEKRAWQQVRIAYLSELRLRIPAGEKRHRVSNKYTLPVDVHAIGALAHMHLLGREMKAHAELPDGKTVPLLWITDWDFNWQGQYQYVKPIPLPRGTVLHMEAYFDNSSDNPKNPNKPPITVWRGPRTVDEMCGFRLQVVVDRPGRDGLKFLRDVGKFRREGREEYRKWLRAQGRSGRAPVREED